MVRVFFDSDAQRDIIARLQTEFSDIERAHGVFVEIHAFVRNADGFNDAVLRGKIRPPGRIEPSPSAPEVAGGNVSRLPARSPKK